MTIGQDAFNGCGLTSVDLRSATSIADGAFCNCRSLTTITSLGASSGLTIGGSAFDGCSSLGSVDVSNVTDIGGSAFKDCTSLATVTGSGKASMAIGGNAFEGCSSLTRADVASAVFIGNSAFKNCTSLDSVDIRSATTFETAPFDGCTSLRSAVMSPSFDTGSISTVFSGSSLENPEAYVDGNGHRTLYRDLKDAIESASSGDKVVLLKDVDLGDSPITIGKSLSLDLSGHSLRADTGPVITVSSGTVLIGGNGRVETASGCAVLNLAGDLTIVDGTFSTSEGYAFGSSFEAQLFNIVGPVGNTTMDGGTFVDGDGGRTIGVNGSTRSATGDIRKKPEVSLDPPPNLSPFVWSSVQSDGYQHLVRGVYFVFNVYDSVSFTAGEGLAELSLQKSGAYSTGTVAVERGSVVTFNAVPQEGYRNVEVTGATYTKTGDVYSVVVDSSDLYTTITLDAEKLYAVTFSHDNDIRVAVNSDAPSTESQTIEVAYGTQVTFTSTTGQRNDGRLTISSSEYPEMNTTTEDLPYTATFTVVSDGTITITSEYKITIADGIEHGSIRIEGLPEESGAYWYRFTYPSQHCTLVFESDTGYKPSTYTIQYSSGSKYTQNITRNTVTESLTFGDQIISAEFIPMTYNIAVSGANGATVAAPSSAEYGSTVRFTVTVSGAYELKEVKVVGDDGTPYDATKGSDGYSFTMPAQDVTITVSTVELHTVALSGDHVSFGNVSVDGVSVSLVDGRITVEHGSSVAFTVMPEAGYRIIDVTNVSSGPDADGFCTISSVAAYTSVVATASWIYYDVTFDLDHVHLLSLTRDGGDIDLSRFDGSIGAHSGSVVVFTLEADEGYGSVTVTGADGSGEGPYTLTMGLGDRVVTASAQQIDYTISKVSDHGVVDVRTTAHFNETVDFTIDVEQGYRLLGVDVMAGDEHVVVSLNDGTYSFSMPSHDVVIDAGYAKNVYTIRYLVDGQEVDSVPYQYQDPIEPYTYSREGKADISVWTGLPDDMRMPAHDLDVNADLSSVEFHVRITPGENTYFVYGGRTYTSEQNITVGYNDNPFVFTAYGNTGYDAGLQVTMDGNDTGLSSGEEYRATVTANHDFVLSTVPNTCTLVFITGEGTTMHVAMGGGSFDVPVSSRHPVDALVGTDVTVTVQAVTGYTAPSTVSVGSDTYDLVEGTCTFSVSSSADVVSGADRASYEIDVQEAEHTRVVFMYMLSVGYGDSVRFTVNTDIGYSEHLAVYFDGRQVHPDSSGVYLVSMPDHDVVLRTETSASVYTVSFDIAEHTYLRFDGESSYITGESFTRTYSHGAKLVFDYYADEGYGNAFTINEVPATSGSYSEPVTRSMGIALYTEPDIHTVIWNDWNGETLYKDEDARYGTDPVYGGAAPSRAADAEYTYGFVGWSVDGSTVIDSIPSVSGDATYIAVYHGTRNVYTVTWVNDDGTVLGTDRIGYGGFPEYSGETPTKASDAEHDYVFDKWSPDIVNVVGDATYTAAYASSPRMYTITWNDWSGSTIGTTRVAYGDVPSYPVPTRDPDAQWTYTSGKWSPDVVAVTGDAVYTTDYTREARQYTVEFSEPENAAFVCASGQRFTAPYGDTVTFTVDAPGYEDGLVVSITRNGSSEVLHSGSSGAYSFIVTADTVVSATTSANTYVVRIVGEGVTVMDGTVPISNGGYVHHGDVLTVDIEERAGHTGTVTASVGEISGGEYTVGSDVTFTGKYTPIPYTIAWLAEDGSSAVRTDSVPYGQVPVPPEAPAKEEDAAATYAFAGWSLTAGGDVLDTIPAVAGDAAYYAVYSTVVKFYTVRWVDADGILLYSSSVAYGEIPEYKGAEPHKEQEAGSSYRWTGWTPEVVAVTGDATYTAVFDTVGIEYVITWKDWDGTLLGTGYVAYGETPAYEGGQPSREGTADTRYVTAGWSPAVVPAVSDATYTAVYRTQYSLTFSAEEGAGFSDISGTPDTVEGGSSTALWFDEGSTVRFRAEASAGYDVVVSGADGLMGDGLYRVEMTSPRSVTASVAPQSYIITISGDGVAVLSGSERVSNGDTVRFGQVLDVSIADRTGYIGTLSCTNGDSIDPIADGRVTVVGDVVIVGSYAPQTFTVTWRDWDGSDLSKSAAVYGSIPVHPGADPVREGYVFAGWSPVPSTITGDAVYTAVYIPEAVPFTVTYDADEVTVTLDGSVLLSGSRVDAGTAVEVRAVAMEGYDVGILANGDPVPEGTYTVVSDVSFTRSSTPVTVERTIVFPTDGVTITDVTVDGDPAEVVDGRLTVPDGSTVRFVVDSDDDVTVVVTDGSGSEAVEPEDGAYTIVVDSDVVVTVIPVSEPSGKDPYVIVWSDWDGTVLALGLANEGETPVYRGATPVRAADEHTRYTFAGWSPAVGPAHDNENYRAVYDVDLDMFTVIWRNWDGTVLETDTVAYGTVPVYQGSAPARSGYSFAGWSPEVTAVTGDAEYTATFTALPVDSYRITIRGEGVTVMNGTVQVRNGESVPAGTVLTVTMEQRDGFDAVLTASVGTVGSNGSYTVTADVTFTGSYTSSAVVDDDDSDDNGFPWWILLVLIVIAIAVCLGYRYYRNRERD